MENTSMLLLLCAALTLLVQTCHATTMVVDGFTVWKNPTVHIGDSIIFKHKYEYKLYIFQNERAFSNCNFSQATLLNKPNSTSFTWFPSRVGLFYFSFDNASLTTCQKLPIKVIPPLHYAATSPELPPTSTPAPTSGGTVSSSPAYPWPFRPRQASSPSPGPTSSSSATSSTLMPEKGGGIPFINSNPAVPLPTGEVDSATIQPLPTSECGRIQVVGLTAIQSVVLLVLVLVL